MQPADRRHHRAAEALQGPGGDQHRQARRQAAQDRADGEDEERQREDASRTEAVGEPAADRNEHRERQNIGGDREVHAQRRGRKASGDIRNCRDDDRRIELLHQECNGDHGGDDVAQAGVAVDREGLALWGGICRIHRNAITFHGRMEGPARQCWRMILSKNRFALLGIMLWSTGDSPVIEVGYI